MRARSVAVATFAIGLLIGTLSAGYLNVHGVNVAAIFGKDKNSSNNINSKRKKSGSSFSGSTHKPPTGSNNSSIGHESGLVSLSCNVFPGAPVGLSSASNPELRKLAQYEQACSGAVAVRSSFFVPTPANTTQASQYASDAASELKQYSAYGIKPLVIMEPDSASGTILNLNNYAAGDYDTALNTYFSDLKSDGVTSPMMGMWVFMPEDNLPEWNNVNPSTFATNVTKTAQFEKKYFPAAQATILLDSETYPTATSWNGGKYISLLSYVKNIPKGLLDSFGLQGFPWTPPKGQAGALYNPKIYLETPLAAQAANSLGVKNIWLNTGTFSESYTNNRAQTVTLSSLQRQTMLNGVLSEARSLQDQGFGVSIHLFAQNKANTSEAINWSYWNGAPGDNPGTDIFRTFARETKNDGISLWIFDTY